VRRDWDRERDKIQGSFNIARDLAQALVDAKKAAKKAKPLPGA